MHPKKTLGRLNQGKARTTLAGGFFTWPATGTYIPFMDFFQSLVEREGEEIIHDEGLLARFWGAWSDACMVSWNTIVPDIANESRSQATY